MPSEKSLANLRRTLTPEEAREMQRRSTEAKKAKRTMQETAKTLLNLALHSGKVLSSEDVLALAELKGQNVSVGEAIAIAQIQKALKGDTTSASFVVSLSGEKPAEKVEVGMSVEEYVKNKKVKL